MIDLHLHGAFGVDVLTADAPRLDRLAQGLAARGVTGFLPTLVPVALDDTARAVSRLSDWIRSRREGDGRGAMPLGLHFEGPFVAHARCGALHAEHFRDNRDERALGAFLEATDGSAGRTMITLAPEIPGGIRLVTELVKRGFVVSIGHTDADAATLDEALAAGARHMTHFGNAMRPLHHRELGPIGWGLLRDGVTVDVIADLHHLAPDMLRLVFKAKGAGRVALISDAMPAAGLPDGPYPVWGETLTVAGGTARNGKGALAGSVTLLDQAVANVVTLGIPEDAVRRSALEVPERILLGT
ncbi:MAG: N-acetylglucosamine-6-phosphate deacetylase [Thermoanaerobaculia bacterium]